MQKTNLLISLSVAMILLATTAIILLIYRHHRMQQRIAAQRIVYINDQSGLSIAKLVNIGDSYLLTDSMPLGDRQAMPSGPRFSPDGKMVVFVTVDMNDYLASLKAFSDDMSDRNTRPPSRRLTLLRNIYLINADGSNQRCITTNAGDNMEPAFSPDGKRIVFTSNRDSKPDAGTSSGGNSRYSIYSMNTDGSDVKQLTHSQEFDRNPTFSLDGKLIAYASRIGRSFKLFVMYADGSQPRQVSPEGQRIGMSLLFSLDGKQIYYYSEPEIVASTGTQLHETHLYAVNLDGSGSKQLPLQTTGSTMMSMGPYGDYILYNNNDKEIRLSDGLYPAKPDGSRHSKTPISTLQLLDGGRPPLKHPVQLNAGNVSCYPLPEVKLP